MKATQRIKMIQNVLESVEESLTKYEEAKKRCDDHELMFAEINREDSACSIIRRCVFAREELLRLTKDLKYFGG